MIECLWFTHDRYGTRYLCRWLPEQRPERRVQVHSVDRMPYDKLVDLMAEAALAEVRVNVRHALSAVPKVRRFWRAT